MDSDVKHHNPSPYLTANPLSKLLFLWVRKIFYKGFRRNLELDDLYNVLPSESSEAAHAALDKEWQKELLLLEQTPAGVPSLRRAAGRAFGLQFFLLGLVVAMEVAIRVVQPLLLGGLIEYFTPGSEMTSQSAYLYAAAVSVCAFLFAVINHQEFYHMQRLGVRLRAACCSLAYRKSLRLSMSGMGQTTTGQMVNLMSNDASRLESFLTTIHFFWISPLQSIAVFVILWYQLGVASMAGLGVLLVLVPLQLGMGMFFAKLRAGTAKETDERIRLLTELLGAVRTVKMYCWEFLYLDMVKAVRKREMQWIIKSKFIWAVFHAVWYMGSKLFLYFTILAYALKGGPLLARRTYITVAEFDHLRKNQLMFFTLSIRFLAEVLVTFKRFQDFLLLDEYKPDRWSNELDKELVVKAYSAVSLCSVACKWTEDSEINTLDEISLDIRPGSLLAVVGPVGCGKTSLLLAILGELPILSGNVDVHGELVYASQQPWVFSASVRQNIVFGKHFDSTRYYRTLKACALTKDIDSLIHGDGTLIGDRGVTLSGGQRSRISLARALYSEADIFLLDDPLSAVDVPVAKHLYEKCIKGVLMNKTRILVTHHLSFIKDAEKILVLQEGRRAAYGTYDELVASGIDFSSLVEKLNDDAEKASATTEQHSPQQTPANDRSGKRISTVHNLTNNVHSTHPQNNVKQKIGSKEYNYSDDDNDDESLNLSLEDETLRMNHISSSAWSLMTFSTVADYEPEPVQVAEEEERKQGSVTWSVYTDYIRAGGGIPGLIFLIIFYPLTHAGFVLSDWWLSVWINHDEDKVIALNTLQENGSNSSYSIHTDYNNITMATTQPGLTMATSLDVKVHNNDSKVTSGMTSQDDTLFYLHVYTILVIGAFILVLIRALIFFIMTAFSSRKLHDDMVLSLIRTSVRFFDKNPTGRILNRFSKDIGSVDDWLPIAFNDMVVVVVLCLSAIIVAGVVNPWVLILGGPMVIMFVAFRQYFVRTSRKVARLVATTRSPVYSLVHSTMDGVLAIRAYKTQDRLIQLYDDLQDLQSEACMMNLACARCFGVLLDLITTLFITLVAFGSVWSAAKMDAGLVGLSLTYAFMLTNYFQYTVRQTVDVENQMVSVERALEYIRLPSEGELTSPKKTRPPDYWPKHGNIDIYHVSLKYEPMGINVLNNLKLCIKPGEKVGVVGRTGAGKSSLLAALFRLVNPCDGHIYIDGVNAGNIGLHELRSKMSIIPQTPMLLHSTVRTNLDPFHRANSSEIWSALEKVQMKSVIKNLPEGLEGLVSEGGSNFSEGEKQLLCLARAMLSHNKVLVFDEATANVDSGTDQLIQNAIREHFRDCTVITVAHRLETIIDSDRILVLDAGEVVDFEEPYLMLKRPESMFCKMITDHDYEHAQRLVGMATEAYSRKHSRLHSFT